MLYNNLTHKIRNSVAEFLNMYLVKRVCMENTFCNYFVQDIKQVLLKVEQAWSTWLVSFFKLSNITFIRNWNISWYITVALILTLHFSFKNDTFQGSFGWTALINYFFFLLSVGKALHSSLNCEETERNKQGESIPGQSTLHRMLYLGIL